MLLGLVINKIGKNVRNIMKKLLSLILLNSATLSFTMEQADENSNIPRTPLFSESDALNYIKEHIGHKSSLPPVKKKVTFKENNNSYTYPSDTKKFVKYRNSFVTYRNYKNLPLVEILNKVDKYYGFKTAIKKSTSTFGSWELGDKNLMKTIDPDFPPRGKTPLILALVAADKSNNNITQVLPLLKRTTDPSAGSNIIGDNPLMMLIDHYDDKKSEDKEQSDINQEILNAFGRVKDLTAKDLAGRSAFLLSLFYGRFNLAKHIYSLMPKIDINKELDENGNGPLYVILYSNYEDEDKMKKICACLQWALDQNSTIDLANNKGKTPLMKIVSNDDEFAPYVTQFLLNNSADPTRQDKKGNTALHITVKKTRNKTNLTHLNVLLKHSQLYTLGLNNIRNYSGETPDMLIAAKATTRMFKKSLWK